MSFPRPRVGVTFFARAPRCRSSVERRSRPVGWRTWMWAIKKVTKEALRRPRAGVLRTPVPCAPRSVEGRRGNSLRSDTRTSSPSPDLRCSARSRRTGRSRSTATASTHGVDLLGAAVALDVGSALSEPSIAGESGAKRRRCLSVASSAPSPDSPRSTGHRCAAPARALAARFFWLLFFSREKKSDTPRGRGNNPPGTPGESFQSFPRAIAWNTPSRRTHRWNNAAPTCISTVANNT